MKGYRINEEKLQRPDTYRVQMQHKSRRNKMIYAILYGFMEDRYHSSAKDVRDYFATETIKKVIETFRIIWKSNPSARATFPIWLEENVDPKLWKEIKQIVYGKNN